MLPKLASIPYPAPQVSDPVQYDLRPPGTNPADFQATETKSGPNASNGQHRLVWALLGFLVALTLVVLIVLPYMVAEHAAEEVAAVDEPADSVQPPPLASSVERGDAEQALQKFLHLSAQPDLANAEQWANDAWQAAMDAAAAGDDHYGRGQFNAALLSYKEASHQLSILQASRSKRLKDSLARGWQLLEQNDVDEAVKAFERVLAMPVDQKEARQNAELGLARATVRNEVLKLMAKAKQAEADNNLQHAAHSYAAALQLDSLYVPALHSSQQLNARLDSLAFQEAMGQALQNLDKGNLKIAREAIESAALIYPEEPAVKDAQRRLAEAQHQSRLNSLRRKAEQSAQNEDWSVAADYYRQAIALDTRAAYARSGLSHSQKRMQLHAQLDHYLADTTRLSSKEPLDNARQLLAANKKLPAHEPNLSRKISSLKEAVRLAVLPVNLHLHSDNETEITIFHVGRIGKFLEKQVTLRPGQYTVTGSRPGYRDVRKVIVLQPGATTQSLLIRCREPI
jgi:hypothetical protein